MKITDIRTYVVDAQRGRTWLFVEVLTDSGEIGIGEASQSRFDTGVSLLIEQWKPRFVGRDPVGLVEPLRTRLLHNPFANRITFAAFSGIEQALWDLAGKAVGQPVYRLLGGAHADRVPLYANLNAAKRSNAPDHLAEVAERAVAEGFGAVKIYPFVFPEESGRAAGAPLTRNEIQDATDRVDAVRQSIGSSVRLLTDWAWNLTPGDARMMAERLEEFDLFWIEEPYVFDDPRALAELRSRITPRLAGGEQLQSARAFAPLFEARALDVIMPDVKWLGGISESRKLFAMAEAYDVEIAPHNMSGPVATAASLHLSVTTRNFSMLEYCWGAVPWRAELVRGTERIEDGQLVLSDQPGLGIGWDPEAAQALRAP